MLQPLPIPAQSAAPDQPGGIRRTPWWLDVLLILFVASIAYGVARAAARWSTPLSPNVRIDTSISLLPLYAGLSTLRMAIAYIVSLVFSLLYARAAAASKAAERVMLPVLDILQSIPILSFMPGVVLALAAAFPGRTVGLELAAIILIFTSQAWNLAFSFHQSLATIPRELSEAADVYRLGAWRRFTRLELPFGAIALIQNSMMSWAGGWFFLMASEQFVLGANNLRLPGLGSYLAAAAEARDTRAIIWGIVALVTVIVALDQVLWRPLVAWSDRFKFEQSGGDASESWMLDLLRNSNVVEWLRDHTIAPIERRLERPRVPRDTDRRPLTVPRWMRVLAGGAASVAAAGIVVWGGFAAFHSVSVLSGRTWLTILVATLATFGRTLAALIIATAWTVPFGVAVGTSPTWSRRLQPVVQVIASIPATALFSVLLLLLLELPGGLNIAAIALMILGTQWYILFNVIAGAMAIPSDLKEAGSVYGLSGWRRWRLLIIPAIFPYLVTGLITATGGAWNASIVSEYVIFAGRKISTTGLGALIAEAADAQNFALLLASTLVMAAVVIIGNRLVWRKLYRIAESRYRLE
ncbi:MAG: ABC transporter permease subunit [Gemmatimonadota bacterium]|nr:ABC transporter permease subunit [Gemmatimonadota bacterium]